MSLLPQQAAGAQGLWAACSFVTSGSLHIRNSKVSMQSDPRLMKTHSLDSGVSETLKVVPHRKLLSVAMASRGGGTEKIGNVINLHFEGNWMPIKASPTGLWQQQRGKARQQLAWLVCASPLKVVCRLNWL